MAEFDRFAICQAYSQLESDYNVNGIVWERPSNRRRRESIGGQLARVGYSNPYGWVDILADHDEAGDPMDETVREIYLVNVLKWGLPIDAYMMLKLREFFVPEFLAKFPQCAGDDYLQNL